jgi:hypothetical protein
MADRLMEAKAKPLNRHVFSMALHENQTKLCAQADLVPLSRSARKHMAEGVASDSESLAALLGGRPNPDDLDKLAAMQSMESGIATTMHIAETLQTGHSDGGPTRSRYYSDCTSLERPVVGDASAQQGELRSGSPDIKALGNRHKLM